MGNCDDCEDEVTISLNMDHPLNREIREFITHAPDGVVDAFFARTARRFEFDQAMEDVGGLTKYRRKIVVRSLVRMFRAGYRSGHIAGFRKGLEEGLGGEHGR